MVVRLLLLLALLLAGPAAALAAEADARLEIRFDTPEPVVGQMILATIRGEYAFGIGREQLKMPPFTDFNWVQIERDKWVEETVGDRRLKVFERRLALFAKTAGRHDIAPFVHNVTVVGLDNRWSERVITSEPATIDIAPAPVAAGPAFMPAARVELTDDWSLDPATLTDGANTTRSVTLTVLGADPERLPAAPVIREPWLISFVSPEERHITPTPAGPLATITWRWQLRPITGEVGTLPAIVLPWYDAASGTMREAAIGPRRIGDPAFGNNTDLVWSATFTGLWRLAVAGGVAFVLALLALLPLVRRLTAAEAARLLSRLRARLPDRDLRSLKRCARSGDVRGLRQAAARWLAARGLGEPQRRALLAPLDRLLFGPQPDTSPRHLGMIAASILKAGRKAP